MENTNRLTLVRQDAVDQFPQQIDRIMSAMGIGPALVTDMSQVLDFLLPMVEGMSKDELARGQEDEDEKIGALTLLVGRKVQVGDYIWEVARDLYHKEQALKNEAAQKARPH